jgi:hypothetical protein
MFIVIFPHPFFFDLFIENAFIRIWKKTLFAHELSFGKEKKACFQMVNKLDQAHTYTVQEDGTYINI